MKRLIAALIIAGNGVGATVALAQQSATPARKSTRASAEEEASRRFHRAVELYRERSFDAALAEFNRAYELAPDYRVIYNIAQTQVERGDYVAASKSFRLYLKEGGTAIGEARTAEVLAELARLEGRIAKVRVVANVEGAELVIDGEKAGTLPMASVPVNAGIRHIIVRKKGYEPREQRLMLVGGEEKSLDLVLQSDAPPPPREVGVMKQPGAPRIPQPVAHSSPNTGFWVSLAATTLAASGSVVFALQTQKAKGEFDDELNRFPGSSSKIDDARSDLKRYALLTDICGGLTVLGIGATVYFAVAGTGASVQPRKAGRTWQTGPLGANQHGLGWQVAGRF